MLFIIIQLALVVFFVAVMWKIFAKAGEPGWACLVPIYNACVMFKIAGKPMWWILLCFIPIVNIIISILAAIGLANKFGKGGGFAVGLILLPFIFYPILAFGDAEYQQ
jgi:hypothetical protein